MAEYVLKINERTKEGKFFIDLMKSYSEKWNAVEIRKSPNPTTIAAIEAVQKGEYTMLEKGQNIESLLDDV